MTEQTNIPKPASPLPFSVGYDGPSRPMIETAARTLLSISRFGDGRWGTYAEEDRDAEYIVWAANNAPKLYELLSRVCKYLDGGGHIEANSDAHMDIDELLRAARGEA